LSINVIFGLIFTLYFAYSYSFYFQKDRDVKTLQDTFPLILNRYTSLMLNYALMRERIINNNSVDTYYNPSSPHFSPQNIDHYYQLMFAANEADLSSLQSRGVLVPIVGFMRKTDS
jgi:hypothetical protein